MPDNVATGWTNVSLAGDGMWDTLHLFPFSWDRTVVAMAGKESYTPRIFAFDESINRKDKIEKAVVSITEGPIFRHVNICCTCLLNNTFC